MGTNPLSLIPELEEVVQNGSQAKRTEALQRITALFLDGVNRYSEAHVDLFDDVFSLLIEEIETKARAELSSTIAPVRNAPVKVLRTLASDDDITVAGPVLRLAPRLAEADIIEVANTKGQAHLQAISARRAIGEAVTDVLVRRGDREVARRVADNRSARISEQGFDRLVKRAEQDGILAEKVGLRPDIPPRMFRDLLMKATAVVHKRLIASASPELRTAICDVLTKVSKEVGARVGPRDYRAAQRTVLSLERAGRLDQAAVVSFCGEGKYEETVVALATLAKVPLKIADRLMGGARPDPALILCKAVNLSWSAAKSVILIHPEGAGTSGQELDAIFANYTRLSTSTAQRVVRFWQRREATADPAGGQTRQNTRKHDGRC